MDGIAAIITPTASIIIASLLLSVQISRNRRSVLKDIEEKHSARARQIVNELHRPQGICTKTFFDRDSGITLEAEVRNLKRTVETGFAEQLTATKSTHQRLDRLLNGHGE